MWSDGVSEILIALCESIDYTLCVIENNLSSEQNIMTANDIAGHWMSKS